MPIKYWIDHARRLVWAAGHGTLTDQDVFGYQGEVWARPDVAGYSELIDMSAVGDIALPSAARVRDLAGLSAGMDGRGPASKFAIVAPGDLAFGLGRMYATYRGLEAGSKKQVGVFRSLGEAWAFLGVTVVSPEPGAASPGAGSEGEPGRQVEEGKGEGSGEK